MNFNFEKLPFEWLCEKRKCHFPRHPDQMPLVTRTLGPFVVSSLSPSRAEERAPKLETKCRRRQALGWGVDTFSFVRFPHYVRVHVRSFSMKTNGTANCEP